MLQRNLENLRILWADVKDRWQDVPELLEQLSTVAMVLDMGQELLEMEEMGEMVDLYNTVVLCLSHIFCILLSSDFQERNAHLQMLAGMQQTLLTFDIPSEVIAPMEQSLDQLTQAVLTQEVFVN